MATYVAILAVVVLIGTITVWGWKSYAKRAEKGGEDRAVRESLEEMARREKEASEIKAGPTPLELRTQLERLRARLVRHTVGRDGD